MSATHAARIAIGIVSASALTLATSLTLAAQSRVAPAPAAGTRTVRHAAGAVVAPAATDTAEISGVVVDAGGKPTPRALVMIAATDRGLIRTVAADAAGRFTLDRLPPGHYLIAAGKPAFIAGMYGAGRVSGAGASLELATGEKRHDIAVAVARGAVIAGRVLDADGQPLPNVRVRVSQRRDVAGEVTLNGDLGDPVNAVTDDRGAFRIFDLEPGVYAVAAQARSNPGAVRDPAGGPASAIPHVLAYQPIYFPAATSAAASEPIVLDAGQVREDVDVHMTLVPLARVSGRIAMTGMSALPSAVQVTLRPAGASAGAIFNVFNARPGADGRFTMANVPPGNYRAFARLLPPPVSSPPGAGASPAVSAYAIADVRVDGHDLNDVALSLDRPASISGHVSFEGLPGLPNDIGSVRVSVRPTPGSAVPFTPDAVTTDPHADFTIAGLAPGKYRLFVQVPNNNVTQAPEWYAKTASIAGADAFDVPFEVVPGQNVRDVIVQLTDDEQEIDGHVRDAAAHPVHDAIVVVFPAERRFWFQGSRRIVVRQTDADGAFVFGLSAALPTGDYFVAAAPALALGPNDQYDTAMLDALSRSATRVSLGANDSKTADLVIRKR